MKKQGMILVLAFLLCVGLEGCSCKHEWLDATCAKPALCAKCGEVAGAPLGHTWRDATCTEPMICAVCGETSGAPLEHQWQEATCTQPETCSLCGETQGDPPTGHALQDDGSCSVCGEKIGVPLTMDDYAKYLTFSMVSQTKNSITNSYNYRPYAKIIVSVEPNSNYTYHNVRVTFNFTAQNDKAWKSTTESRNLSESGFFRIDGIYTTDGSRTFFHQTADGLGDFANHWMSSNEFFQYANPSYSLKVTNITGYVVPVGTDIQGD